MFEQGCERQCMLTLFQQEDIGVIRQVDPSAKEVSYNPRYEEMFSPQVCVQFVVYFTIGGLAVASFIQNKVPL